MKNTEQHVEETHGEHEGLIKTPKQLIVVVTLAFIVPIIVILLLVSLVTSSSRSGSGSDAQTPEAIASRIKPVAGFNLVDANAPKVFKTGQQVFESTCTSCHTAGVAGAPKVGDEASWAPFIKKGYEELVKNAIHGIGAMPPKGGNPSLSDFEVERAVVYMANQSGATFDEPKEPAAEGQADDAKPAAANQSAAAATPAPAAPGAPATAAAPAGATGAGAQGSAVVTPAPDAQAAAPAAQAAAAAAPAEIDPAGEKLYKAVCFACHATGVAGAPKYGDKAAWAKYIETGLDAMVQNAIHGVGAMPPRGGSQASDAEVKAAVQYILHSVQ